MSLWPRPYVVCRCGRVYFEYDAERLWACARQHFEDDERAAEFHAMVQRLMREPQP